MGTKAVASHPFGCIRPTESMLWMSSNDNEDHRPQRGRRRRKWFRRSKKFVATLAFAWSILSSGPARADPAIGRKADFDNTMRANDILMQSIRPGSSVDQAEKAVTGEEITISTDIENMLGLNDEEITPVMEDKATKKVKKSKKKKTSGDLYGEDDDDFTLDELQDSIEAKETKGISEDMGSQFETKEYGTDSYFKTFLTLVTGPLLIILVREIQRRRNENAYVNKALKIQAEQKAEYMRSKQKEMNATKVELQNNSTKVEDDDKGEDDKEEGKDTDAANDGSETKAFSLEELGIDINEDGTIADEDDSGDGGESDGPTRDDIDRLNSLLKK